jgi:hypothetical protein
MWSTTACGDEARPLRRALRTTQDERRCQPNGGVLTTLRPGQSRRLLPLLRLSAAVELTRGVYSDTPGASGAARGAWCSAHQLQRALACRCGSSSAARLLRARPALRQAMTCTWRWRRCKASHLHRCLSFNLLCCAALAGAARRQLRAARRHARAARTRRGGLLQPRVHGCSCCCWLRLR